MNNKKLLEATLSVSVAGKKILDVVSLFIRPGELVAVMGPNGAGKSTLAHALMGRPGLSTKGSIKLDSEELVAEKPETRASKGMFLSFQQPPNLPGVTLRQLLRTSINAQRAAKGEPRMRLFQFTKLVEGACENLGLEKEFLERSLEGLSGGEQKKIEMLQLLIIKPRLAILDEIDSGLDIDALRIIAGGISSFRSPENGLLLITHYQRILNYVKPDRVLILKNGVIVKEGGPELVAQLEKEGYESI